MQEHQQRFPAAKAVGGGVQSGESRTSFSMLGPPPTGASGTQAERNAGKHNMAGTLSDHHATLCSSLEHCSPPSLDASVVHPQMHHARQRVGEAGGGAVNAPVVAQRAAGCSWDTHDLVATSTNTAKGNCVRMAAADALQCCSGSTAHFMSNRPASLAAAAAHNGVARVTRPQEWRPPMVSGSVQVVVNLSCGRGRSGRSEEMGLGGAALGIG